MGRWLEQGWVGAEAPYLGREGPAACALWGCRGILPPCRVAELQLTPALCTSGDTGPIKMWLQEGGAWGTWRGPRESWSPW